MRMKNHPLHMLSSLKSSAHHPPSMAPIFGTVPDQTPQESFGVSLSFLGFSSQLFWLTIASRSGRNIQSWPMFVKPQLKKSTCLHWPFVLWMITGKVIWWYEFLCNIDVLANMFWILQIWICRVDHPKKQKSCQIKNTSWPLMYDHIRCLKMATRIL